MSKRFLVAIDGSEHAWKALDLAAELAESSAAELLVLHVVAFEPVPNAFREFAEAEHIPIEERTARFHYDRTIGDAIVREAEARARKVGIRQITTRVAEGDPANEIVSLARSGGVDMVFLGSRGLSDIKGLFVGSVSHKVMHLVPCTCVAVR